MFSLHAITRSGMSNCPVVICPPYRKLHHFDFVRVLCGKHFSDSLLALEGFINFFLCFHIKPDYYFFNCFISWGWRFSHGREESVIARKVHSWCKAVLNSHWAELLEKFPKHKHCLDCYSIQCEQIPFALCHLCQFIPFCDGEMPGAHQERESNQEPCSLVTYLSLTEAKVRWCKHDCQIPTKNNPARR